jgi:hypothetical protein
MFQGAGTPGDAARGLVVVARLRTEYQVGFPGTHDAPRDPNAPSDSEASPERASAPSAGEAPSPTPSTLSGDGREATRPMPDPPSRRGTSIRWKKSSFGGAALENGNGATTRESSESTAWDWFAAERIAVAVAGRSSTDLDDAHAILIHLHERLPTSSALASAVDRGVPYDRLWQDDRFLAAVWTIAANKLTDLRRAAVRRRAPRFRRPNQPASGTEAWHRYPRHFRLVSADTLARPGPSLAGDEVEDGAAGPEAEVEAATSASLSREVLRSVLPQLRRPDAIVLDFAYFGYVPELHGGRVDEALAAHLSAHGARPVSRDAARRRLTDSRIRLEDAIVGAHRHGLMHLLRTDDRLNARGPNPGTSMDVRTALVTYLSIVGTRPRDVVIDTAYATVIAASDPSRRVWEDRRSFMETLLPELRSLYRRYEATLADPAPRNGFSRSHAGGGT